MRRVTALILCLCALLAACAPPSQQEVQPQAGIIIDGEYQYAPINWRISMPWRWNVLSPQQLEAMLGKGRGLVEKAAGSEVVDTETHLLYLRFNESNLFSSSVSPFDASEGSEQEQVAATFDLMLAAYEAGNIRAQGTRDIESVGGIRFDLLRISILDPEGRREILQQNVYLGRVGTSWLTVSITTANWILRQQMLHSWRASRFSTPRHTE